MNIIPFLLFVVAMTGTPGPGNLTMMAIGQATGFRSALPFLSGTTIGFLSLNTAVGFGLGELMSSSTALAGIMKMLGAGYICYLGLKVLLMTVAKTEMNRSFTLIEGLLVHPVSPKSWAMSVVGFSQFSTPDGALISQVSQFASIFLVGQVLFHSLWCWIGASIMVHLKIPWVRGVVNLTVVALMIGATFYAMFV